MENYVRSRITQLRIYKGISEYQLSYDFGHSRGYINNITSGKSLPSMSEFFSICVWVCASLDALPTLFKLFKLNKNEKNKKREK